MAQGDFVWFEQALVDIFKGVHDLDGNVLKVALVNGTTVPAIDTAGPHFGGTGTTNFATDQAPIGGNYAGPVTLANNVVAWHGVNDRVEIDWDDPATWATDALNPTDVEYAIIYDDSDVNKRAIGFIDLGGTFDMTTGPLSLTFGTPAAYIDHV